MEPTSSPSQLFPISSKDRVPIPSNNPHPNSRYSMPRIHVEITGRGNKLQTILKNLPEVSESVRIPENILTKFIGFDLGTQSTHKKANNGVISSLKGSFTSENVQKSIDSFLWKYAICKSCELPETYLKVDKKKITAICNSCGENFEVDSEHKIASFIVKNPPKNLTEIKSSDVGYKNIEKKINENQESLKNKKYDKKMNEDELDQINMDLEDIDKDELLPGNETLELICSHLNGYYDHVTNHGEKVEKDQQKLLYKRIKKIQFMKNSKDRIDYALFSVVFSDTNDIPRRLKFMKKILKKLKRNKKAQINFLLSLKYFVYVKHGGEQKMRKLVSTFLMKFYEEKFLKEKFFEKWRKGDLNKKMKKSFLYDESGYDEFVKDSGEFLKWLVEKSDSSSSSDDSDEDADD